jgi:IS1 family transposase
MRYQKIQDAYNKFVHALIDHVFGERQDHIGAVETASAMNEMEDNYDAEPPKL